MQINTHNTNRLVQHLGGGRRQAAVAVWEGMLMVGVAGVGYRGRWSLSAHGTSRWLSMRRSALEILTASSDILPGLSCSPPWWSLPRLSAPESQRAGC